MASENHSGAEPVGASPTTVIENQTDEHCDGCNDHDETQITSKSGSCGTGSDDQIEGTARVNVTPQLIDCETREQPSSGVDLDETEM